MPNTQTIGLSYDPHTELEHMGIPLLREWLRDTWGVWSPRHGAVVVAEGLSVVQERCVLAHEIEHILARDAGCAGRISIAAERHADRLASRKLIALSDYCRVRQWAQDMYQMAEELQVTPWMLRARAEDLEGRCLGTSKTVG